MMNTTIWHNPRCSKSRETLALLREHDVEPAIRLYLEDGPSAQELRAVLELLGVGPRELMRRGEAEYHELGLKDVDDDDELVAAMAAHPRLIERPVVIRGSSAVLGRPPENVLELL